MTNSLINLRICISKSEANSITNYEQNNQLTFNESS